MKGSGMHPDDTSGLHLAWASVRNLGVDLCATTQLALLDGLAEAGHHVSVLSPGGPTEGPHDWQHLGVDGDALFGLRSRKIAKGIAARWAEMPRPDLVLVEWPLLPHLRRSGVLKGVPWLLIDRSPPAQAGFRGRLHWFTWRRAWNKAAAEARRRPGPGGTTVSVAHRVLVGNQTSTSEDEVLVLPAGVNLDLFVPGAERRGTNEEVRLFYHGRLDRNRGVLSLPMLLNGAQAAGIDASLTMVGEGDAKDALLRMAKKVARMEVLDRMPRKELARKLGLAHVGLLPMPDEGAWSVASPLKRGEYLASGMYVLGVDHAGHRLEGLMASMALVPQDTFIEEGVNLLTRLSKDPGLFFEGKREARAYAEANLGWSHGVDALLEAIDTILETHRDAGVRAKTIPGIDAEPNDIAPDENVIKDLPSLDSEADEGEPAEEEVEDPEDEEESAEPTAVEQPTKEEDPGSENEAQKYTTLHERMSKPPPQPLEDAPSEPVPEGADPWSRPPAKKW